MVAQKILDFGQGVQRKVGRDSNEPKHWSRIAGFDNGGESVAQNLRARRFIILAGEYVLVEEALARQRTVEVQRGLLGRCRNFRTFKQGEAIGGQKLLKRDVANWRRLQEASKQSV